MPDKPRKVKEIISEYITGGDPPKYVKTKTVSQETYGFWIPSHKFWFWPCDKDQDWLHKQLTKPPTKLDGSTIDLKRSMQDQEDKFEILEERPATKEEQEKLEWY